MGPRRQPPARAEIGEATACHADAVSKVYGRRDTAVHALRDVTLSVERGTFTAVMGPSGSGKSTLLHCLAALDTPTAGRVFLGRTELTALSRRQQALVRRDRIGFVFQAFNLVPTLDVLENVTLPQRLAGRRPDRDWLDHVISTTGLADRLRHRPGELSGGQQQRVALARALAGRPEVIFADEPTGNLDTASSTEMLTLLRDAVDQFDQTVITVTHDPTIARYADRVLFVTDGRVVDDADRPDVELAPAPVHAADGSRGLHVRPRQDGHDTMRSRRRRQSDATTPGRPMVGSDDEVEVARQERWLQRIREQFEAEQGLEDEADPWATAPTGQRADDALDPRAPTPPHRPGAQQAHDADAGHPVAGAPEVWTPPADPLDEGWLPPHRSRFGAGPDTESSSPPFGDDGTPQEPAPWSRPDDQAAAEATGAQSATAWSSDPDPWAPPDRDLAEEYHHDTGTTPPLRGWQADDLGRHDRSAPGVGWRDDARRDAVDRPLGSANGHRPAEQLPLDQEPVEAEDAAADEMPVDESRQAADDTGRGFRYDRWRPPTDDVAVNGWTHDDEWRADTFATRNGDHDEWRADTFATRNGDHDEWRADPPAARNGDNSDGHRDPRPHPDAATEPPTAWTARAPDPITEHHGVPDSDPWGDVWETTSTTDKADPWSPPRGNGQRAYERPDVELSAEALSNGDAPYADGARLADAHDDSPPTATDTAPDTDSAPQTDSAPTHDDTPPTDTDTAPQTDSAPTHDDTPPSATGPLPQPVPDPTASAAGDDAPPAVPVEQTQRAVDQQRPDPTPTARHELNGRARDARPRAEAMIPPPLASLRNLRRPDEEIDPSETLQSLQAQLAKLGSGARNGTGRPRGAGTSEGDRLRRR